MSRTSSVMSPKDEAQRRHIAHNLLVELLAHQFAFPVRWIDTQNVLFSREKAISRFVELGPSNILANMAKRTRDSKYLVQDRLLCSERSFLASTRDTKQIRYHYETENTTEPVEESNHVPAPIATPPPTQQVEEKPLPSSPQATAVAASSVADVPTSALEIIRALVAYKLRKPMEQVSPKKSIKDLSAGKSTLQNELVGDIGNEFGSSPDGAEDLPLATLADNLEPKNSGQMGKTSSELIARFISSTMPARFNLNSIREHLKQNWGLGPSRQASVMLVSMTMSAAESLGRLPSVGAAKELLDKAAKIYAESCGLVLQQQSSAATQQRAGPAIDSSVLEKFSQEQRLLANIQYKALTSYLGVDNPGHFKLVELEKLQQNYEERLDLWSSEFGPDFEAGIKSSFNPKHQRHFNFWWNQARQEIYSIYNDVACQKEVSQDNPHWKLSLLEKVANKSSTQTLTLARKLNAQSMVSNCSRSQFAVDVEKIAELSISLLEPPKATFHLRLTRPRTVITHNGSIKSIEEPRFHGESHIDYSALLKNGMKEMGGARPCFAGLMVQKKGRWEVDAGLTTELFDSISKALGDGLTFSKKVVLVTGAGNGSIGSELVKNLLMGGATVVVTTSREISDAQPFFRSIYTKYGARGSELFVLPFNQGSVKDCRSLIEYIYSDSGLGLNIDVVIPFAAIPEVGLEIDRLESKSELAHRLMLVNFLRLLGCIIQQKNEANIYCRPTQVLLPLSPNHGILGGDGLYGESKIGLESLLNRFSSESWGDKISICGVIIGWTRGTGLMESNDILAEKIESHGVLTFSQEEMALNILALLTPNVARLCEDEPIIADFGGGFQGLEGMKQIMTEARLEIRQEAEMKKAMNEEDDLERSTINGGSQDSQANESLATTQLRSTHKIEFPPLPRYGDDLENLKSLQGMVDLSSTVVIVGFSELGPWGNARTRWQMESQRKLSQAGYVEMAWMMGLIKHFDGERAGGHYVGWLDAKSGESVQDDQIPERYGEYILNHTGVRLIEPQLLGGYDPHKKEYLQEVAIEEDLPEFDATLATAEAFKLKQGDQVIVRPTDDPDSFRVQVKAGAHIMVPKAIPLPSSVVAGLVPSGWSPANYGIPDDIISQVDTSTLYTLCCVSEAFLSAGIENPMEVFKYFHVSEIGNFLGSSLGGTEKNRQMFRDVYLDRQVQGDVLQETNMNTPAAWVNMLLLGSSGPIKTPVGACATSLESLDIGVDSITSGKTKMCLVGGFDNFHEDESYAFSAMKATVDTAKEFAHGRKPAEMSRPTAESRAGFVESQGCGVQLVCSAEIALRMGLPVYAVVGGSTMASDKISRSVPAPGKGILTFARESPDAIDSPLLSVDYRREQMKASISRILAASEGHPTDTYTSGTLTPATSASDSSGSDSSEPVLVQKPSSESIMLTGTQEPFNETTLNARINAARRQWGNQFRVQNPSISPMRAALAVWGLTIDDIDIASLHGTSTKANDLNEPGVIDQQMNHLGRKGIPLLAICQKSVTGHPKAPAAAWMLNGCLQVLNTGLVPGNYNCDNIDPALEKIENLIFPTEPIQMKEVKAFLLSSFGFGQKGAQMVGIAPKYLFATLDRSSYENYSERCSQRKRSANRAFARALMTNSIFKAQAHPPYEAKDESNVLLDPMARASTDQNDHGVHNVHFDHANLGGDIEEEPSKWQSLSATPFNEPVDMKAVPEISPPKPDPDLDSTAILAQTSLTYLLNSMPANTSIGSIGIDLESLDTFTSDSDTIFLSRNYTDAELDFATRSRDPHATFVSRWCAKEAIFKSLGVKSKGAGAPLREIEIWSDGNEAPRVKLSGAALQAAQDAGIQDVKLSLSYGDHSVVAVAVSVRE